MSYLSDKLLQKQREERERRKKELEKRKAEDEKKQREFEEKQKELEERKRQKIISDIIRERNLSPEEARKLLPTFEEQSTETLENALASIRTRKKKEVHKTVQTLDELFS